MRRILALAAIAATAAPLVGCSGDRAGGLAATKYTGGPTVIWDLEQRPLPEIPLPNDVVTRLDATSPTGRRLDFGTVAPTRLESRMLAQLDALDGFGASAPITVSFDAPLDVKGLRARHANDDFRDDAVYLVNVDATCKRFGEEIALDVGRGRFPVIVGHHGTSADPGGAGNLLFEEDPLRASNNLLFEERDEDANGNGELDPGEDTDFDEHLDRPNLDDPHACDGFVGESRERDRCVADHLMTFYDRESETLILRPVWPLEERCAHAVVLTSRLTGEDGRAVVSPLPAVNPRDQTQALAPLASLLARYGLGVGDVAFTWTFTTGTMTTDLARLREGLHGKGPFAHFAKEYPVADLTLVTPSDTAAMGGAIEPGGCADPALVSYARDVVKEPAERLCAIGADTSAVAGFVAGTFTAPNLLHDKDELATANYPADDDETWELDGAKGTAKYQDEEVTFWCALPRLRDTSCSKGNPEGRPFCAPFPTIVYAHGDGKSREEVTRHMGRHAAMGMATCGIDAYGHGGNRALAMGGDALPTFASYGVPGLGEVLFRGRDRDLNNDGIPDPGGDLWSSSLFHTRDVIRQTALEHMQFVRILRSFDGARKAKNGGILGDFDGDGTVDVGGPDNTLSLWGISLGGTVAGILAAAEPSLDAVSPNAGGAGLGDVLARSEQPGVAEAGLLPIVGPFVVGTTTGDKLSLGFIVNDVNVRGRVDFAEISGVSPGDRVQVRNVTSGVTRWALVSDEGGFRVAIPADALGPIERRPLLGLDDEPAVPPVRADDPTTFGDRLEVTFLDGETGAVRAKVTKFGADTAFQGTLYPAGAPLVALQQGLGLRRNSPAFRRYVGLSQMVLDPADPAIWAAHYVEDRIDASYDPTATPGRTHVLVAPTSGDTFVPVSTGIAMARNAGLLGSWRRDPSLPAEQGWRELFTPDPRYEKSVERMLVDTFVIEGVARLERYPKNQKSQECNFDVDDLSDGRAEFPCAEFTCDKPFDVNGSLFSCPAPPAGKALRQDRPRSDGSFDAMRIPFPRPDGQHGVGVAEPARAFDADTFFVNFTTRFLRSRGRDVAHVPCSDCSASAIPSWSHGGAPFDPAKVPACTPADLKLCDGACAASIDLRTAEDPVVCE